MTPETFKIEILPMKHKLFRFASRLLQNIPEAEDVIQEVFIRLWDRRDGLSQYRNLEAFAMTITKNLCLDRLKSKRNKSDEFTEKHERTDSVTPYHQMEMSDSYRKINLIIGQLPDQQRMIIQLRDIEGYEYKEIEEITGMNPNAIRVNLSRARKQVRETMKKNYDYEFTKN
jgi:RNA polymerase sigma-70 factor (ECF subfamily)